MSITSSELETILAERLELVRREKAAIREGVEDLEGKLKISRQLMMQAPRESEEEIVMTMQKLERTHATTPQSNAEERDFMREMDRLRQKRKAVVSYLKIKAEFEEQRAKLTELRKQQAEKDDSITELYNGLRKVKIANKAGCSNADIFDRKFTVESSKVARIVGKGGSNLRFLEGEYCVSIEIDNSGGVIRLMGTEAAMDAAFDAIMTIVETSIEEFPLSDEIIVCLMMDRAQRVNDLQTQFSVRLDISRAKNLCKITGLTENVIAAKAHITSLQSIRTDMLLETSALSAIIGKGGSSITALQEEFRVAINVNRDRSTVEVVGMRPDVAAALARIKDIVEVNREVEEIIQLEKHVLMGCLMGAGGQGLRSISKEHSVRIDSEIIKDSPLQSIKIKGNNGKVHSAKAHIIQLVGEYISNSLAVEVPDDVIPVILGKGGSGIKAFREKFPGANIDIDGTSVHIQSSSAEQRAAIKAEVDAILEANYSQLVEFDEEGKIQLRSSHGADTRTKLTKDLNVRLIIDGSPTAVKVRGSRADVLRAVAALQAFKQSHTNEKVILTDEDFPVLLNSRTKGGDDSLVRGFEGQFNVEIKALRKELCLFISGTPQGVAAAKEAIHGVLSGDAKYGAQLVPLHKLVTPTLIGKAGANIAKMEGELGVKFDVLKSTEQLRILADSAEKAIAARKAVLRFVQGSRVTDAVTVDVAVGKKEVDAIVRRAAEIFQVEISGGSGRSSEEGAEKKNSHAQEGGSKTFTIKGAFSMVLECKEFLAQQLSGRCSSAVPILPQHHAALEKQVHGSLKRLQEKFSVTLQLSASEITLEGATDAVAQAKKETVKLLEKYFPAEFAMHELSASCLRESFGEDFVVQMAELEVSAKVDRAQSLVLLVGEPDKLAAAKNVVNALKTKWEECHASLPIDSALVPALVGKAGASINALRKETNVAIDINTTGTCVDIKGSSKALVDAARGVLERRIRQLQAERWEISTSAEFLPVLIGKQGANIIKLRADTGAGIDVDGTVIKVYGSEEKVSAAKAAILELLNTTEVKQAGNKVLVLPPASIALVIGAKGATVREMQEKTGARFDFDRVTNKCSLKGSVEGVESAIKLVNELLERGNFPAAYVDGHKPAAAPVVAEKVEAAAEEVHADNSADKVSKPKVLVGAHPSVSSRAQQVNLSKSALKRLRRKQAQEAGEAGADEDAEEEGEEDGENAPALEEVAMEPPAPTVQEVPVAQPTVHVKPVLPAVVGGSGPVYMAPASGEKAASAPAPVPQVPTPAHSAAIENLREEPVPKLGVIGKSQRLIPAEVESFRASVTTPAAHQAAPAAAPAPHLLQQQQLINLLLGDSSAASSLGALIPPAPAANRTAGPPQYQQQQYHIPPMQQYQQAPSQYAPHSSASGLYGQQFSTQPSALYAPSVHSGHVVPPPGISPQGRSAPSSSRLAVQTHDHGNHALSAAYSAHTPPPPGLTPPGGVSTSRFTFAEYAPPPASSAPPLSSLYSHQPISSSAFPAPSAAASAPAPAPVKPASSSGNYYKSKSGFSVRL